MVGGSPVLADLGFAYHYPGTSLTLSGKLSPASWRMLKRIDNMADLLRISLGGSLPNGEKWTVNPVWSLGGDFGDVDVSPTQAQTIAAAIAAITFNGPLLTNFAANTTIATVRVEARTLANDLEAVGEAAKSTPQNGTSSVTHPFQTAWVSSLRTSFPGASGRGRLYWPATGVTLQPTTYRPSTSNTLNFATEVETALSQIGQAIAVTFPTGTSLCVWSRTKSTLLAVTSIQVGDILDTQRRRRDSLVESVSSVAWTP